MLQVLQAAVVVKHSDRQHLLGALLANDVLVEESACLHRRGKRVQTNVGALAYFFFNDFIAQLDALVADVHTRSSDELFDLFLRLATERTLQEFAGV